MGPALFNYKKFSATIDDAVISDGFEFKYSWFKYKITMYEYTARHLNRQEPPIFWQACRKRPLTAREIWLPTNVYRSSFHKPVLFHEALEAHLYRKLESDSSVIAPMRKAHQIAMRYEQAYAGERLGKKAYKDFLGLRDELARLIFCPETLQWPKT